MQRFLKNSVKSFGLSVCLSNTFYAFSDSGNFFCESSFKISSTVFGLVLLKALTAQQFYLVFYSLFLGGSPKSAFH